MTTNTAVATRTVKDLVLKDGMPVFKNIEDQLLWAESLLRTGMLPQSYKTAGQVLAGMQMALELGMNPGVKSLSKTAIINGAASIWGELPLALCQSSGKLEDFEGYHFDKDLKKICFENANIKEPVYGYYFKALRKGAKTPIEDYYTTDRANQAGIYKNVWLKHTDDMLRHRTIAKVLKVVCADVLGGVSIAEYDHNTMGSGAEFIQSSVSDGPQESETNDRFEDDSDIVTEGAPVQEIIEEAVVVGPDIIAPRVTATDIEKNKATQFSEAVQKVSGLQPENGKTSDAKVEDIPVVKEELTPQAQEIQQNIGEAVEKVEKEKPVGLKDFEIKIGKHTGKTLGQLTMDQLIELQGGISAYLDKEEDKDAEKLLKAVTDYVKIKQVGL